MKTDTTNTWKDYAKDAISFCLIISSGLLLLGVLYFGIASAAFQWNNPKANRLQVFREFSSVIRFEKMEKYQ